MIDVTKEFTINKKIILEAGDKIEIITENAKISRASEALMYALEDWSEETSQDYLPYTLMGERALSSLIEAFYEQGYDIKSLVLFLQGVARELERWEY